MKRLLCLLIALPAIAFSQNLIQNGSLESWDDMLLTPLNWTVEGSITEDNTEFTDGTSSALLVNGTTTPKLIATNYTLEVGKTYQLSFDYKVKTANPSFGQQVIGYAFGGADFTPNTNGNRIPQNFDWDTVTAELTPTQTESWYLEISLFSFIGDAFEVYIDNIQVVETGTTAQRDALVALYNATNGDGWTNSWDINGDMSTWNGVTLDALGELQSLDLFNNNLTGVIPPEIGNLTALESLDLSRNNLYAGVPTEVANLTLLKTLKLNQNQLDQEIFTKIISLTALEVLDIDTNFFTGNIPSAIGNLTNLTHLTFNGNNFSGSIPIEIGNLTNLGILNASYSNLNGTIPSQIGNLTNLTNLQLQGNQLNGTIPTEVGNLNALEILFLDNNQLSGTVPAGIKNISSLKFFSIFNNNFVFEDFENDFTALSGLDGFSYSPQANVDITEAIEATVGGDLTLSVTGTQSPNNAYQWYKDGQFLSSATSASLVLSNISNSDFGAYHCEVTNTNVSGLTLQKNTVTVINPIPQTEKDALIALYNATSGVNWTNTWDINGNAGSWYGVTFNSSGNVSRIDLRSNNLIGTLPPEIGNLPFLEYLNLNNNGLTGSLPLEIGNLSNLEELNLGTNQISGSIPPEIGNLPSLIVLNFYLNQFSGEIPAEMGNLFSLQDLNLSSNQLTGGIPVEFENLTNLIQMELNQNQLSGTIDPLMGLTNLKFLDLRINNFTGEIPVTIGNLSQLITIELFGNQFSGNLPAELFTLFNLEFLGLSNNSFSGEIPTGLSNLSSIQSFNISYNQLSGTIPSEIGSLSQLNSLSINNNNFDGPLPSDIKNLPNLNSLFIQNNNFVFEDFENDFTSYNTLASFVYSPQATIDTQETIETTLGENVTLTVNATQSLNNTYQWRKDGIELLGETGASLVLPNISNTDLGLYDCIITNPNVPGLTLYKNTINIINPIPQAEKDALIAFYNATGGPNWTNTWDLNSSASSWYGITYNTDGRVSAIDLRDNNLTGSLPREIGDFSELETLFLLVNQLEGPIPQEIGNLTKLKRLSFSSNQLTGEIPIEVGRMTSLERFFVNDNQLSGIILTEFGNLTNLEALSLTGNQFFGNIPVEIGNLTNLTFLNLSKNQLVGEIPAEIGNLNLLDQLYLYDNQLEGSIPVEIANLTNLRSLYLNQNQLYGPIPTGIKDIASLQVFFISDNKFVFEDFENDFTSYSVLNSFNYAPQANVDEQVSIDLVEGGDVTFTILGTQSPNNSYQWRKNGEDLFGETNATLSLTNTSTNDLGTYDCLITNSNVPGLTIEKNEVEITTSALRVQKEALIALYNATDGPNWTDSWDIDQDMSTWFGVTLDASKNVTNLSLVGNKLNGILPSQLGDLSFLNELSLSSNQLSGEVPVEIGNLTNLVVLDAFNNQLSGSIPVEIGNLTQLQNVDLGENQFMGDIPNSIGNLIQLQSFYVDGNNLSGNLPVEIGNLTQLQVLYLSGNSLTGSIPREIGNLSQLQVFKADDNDFTGEIPVEIGNMTSLSNLELSFNQLSGTIPSVLGSLTNLYLLEINGNQLEGDIPIELGNLTNLQTLVLYQNQLSGNIPVELGNLTELRTLSLANNELAGAVPSQLGNLTKLEGLILHGNALSGQIPSVIKDITTLSAISIENNQFVFDDFESDFAELIAKGLSYEPQGLLDTIETLTVVEEENITLSVNATSSPNNSYQWQKNGIDIFGANSKDFTITGATFDDAAHYSCIVTNSVIPNLTLIRNTITLEVTIRDADSDGVADDIDQCSNTPTGESVDANGCSPSQLDDDNDGITNDLDQCPNTPGGDVVDTNGCSQNELDDDNDGIVNSLDQCSNTPSGDIVDSNGCSATQLVDIVPGDIEIEVISTSCNNKANGEIKVSFKKDYTYKVEVVDDNQNPINFDNVNASQELIIPGLNIGVYSVCVSIPNEPLFESQCFEAIVEAPGDLKVAENKIGKKTATYTVSGSKYYSVKVNSESYEFNFEDTSERQISFELQNGSNNVEIKTDKICQGKFSKIITTGKLLFYPIPATDELTISGLDETETTISVSNLTGSVVFSKTITNKDQYSIPMHNVAAGMYMITIINSTQTINTKIFKK
ncbi:leucine-rich repeat domain-containing protein [Aquimarina gracilis]|uniref:non-specific serine/threonine protein kinase n=1 Tax=Aquimarina gracilis TaxID=874422 RepID=A0ABU5ZPZ7_9FLAO|nr:leucine-rich repeat domain-containing protein [Aquimarina gracilis]MEB3344158.1 leucine-rich repeat domain-containing protein [Aquimarina gracilis]